MFKEALYRTLRHDIPRQRSQRVDKPGSQDWETLTCAVVQMFAVIFPTEVCPLFFESLLTASSLMAPDLRIYDLYTLSHTCIFFRKGGGAQSVCYIWM